MNVSERLVFCKQCKNKQLSANGLLCAITHNKPAFNGQCINFEIDAQEAVKIASKQQEVHKETSNKRVIWVVLGVALLLFKIIVRLANN